MSQPKRIVMTYNSVKTVTSVIQVTPLKENLKQCIVSRRWEDVLKVLHKNPSLTRERFAHRTIRNDWSLLHFVSARQPPLNVVLTLLSLYKGYVKEKDSLGRLPLHIACRYQAKPDMIRLLIAMYPSSTSEPTKDGALPLHLACLYTKDKRVVQVLMDANSVAAHVSDHMGLTPFDYASDNPRSIKFDLLVILTKHIPTAPTPTTTTTRKESTQTKTCVVCMDLDVTHILSPCGHPCLCHVCSSDVSISQMKYRCPECRSEIQSVMKIFGRVVNN